jgi:hypothetical protein
MARRKVNRRNPARNADSNDRYAPRDRPTRHTIDQFGRAEHPAPLSRKVSASDVMKP